LRPLGIRVYGEGGPVKLVAGGLHGREWRTTRKVTDRLPVGRLSGTLVVAPRVARSEDYISTVRKEYYGSEAGRALLNLLSMVRPSIYVELHAYARRSLERLTDPERIEKCGVPPFYRLRGGYLLIGSVSHHLLSLHPLPAAIALEIPMKKDNSAEVEDALRILRVVCEACDVEDVWRGICEAFDDEGLREYVGRIRSWILGFAGAKA